MNTVEHLSIGETMTLGALRRNSNSLADSIDTILREKDSIESVINKKQLVWLLERLMENIRTQEKLCVMIRERLQMSKEDSLLLGETKAYCTKGIPE